MKKKIANLLMLTLCFVLFQNHVAAQSSLLKDARSARGQIEKKDVKNNKEKEKERLKN